MTRGVRHGMRYTREYSIWCNMKTRCDNPNFKDAKYYSEKGIAYDRRWQGFEAFYEDMGPCPEGHTLDRINNNLGYFKENCRWADYTQQALNRNLGPITGIHWEQKRHFNGAWVTRVTSQGKRKEIYRGKDFFEACCARKSWENKNVTRD